MSRFRTAFAAATIAAISATSAVAGNTAAPAGASVYIVSPSPGETIASPVTVVFGLNGMGVAPAGVEKAKTGHHHLIINAPLPAADDPIPADDNHRHFGGGQTQVTLDLPAGQHTLQMLLGDHNHIPHNPVVASEQITITVK